MVKGDRAVGLVEKSVGEDSPQFVQDAAMTLMLMHSESVREPSETVKQILA